MAISEAMTGADEWDNTRELDAILVEANAPAVDLKTLFVLSI